MDTPHICVICLGSNFYRVARMSDARRELKKHFPRICFGTEMETEAIGEGLLSPFSNQIAWFATELPVQEVRTILKQIELDLGRHPYDKHYGVVRMDIDLLKYDYEVLKPAELEKDYILRGLKELGMAPTPRCTK